MIGEKGEGNYHSAVGGGRGVFGCVFVSLFCFCCHFGISVGGTYGRQKEGEVLSILRNVCVSVWFFHPVLSYFFFISLFFIEPLLEPWRGGGGGTTRTGEGYLSVICICDTLSVMFHSV